MSDHLLSPRPPRALRALLLSLSLAALLCAGVALADEPAPAAQPTATPTPAEAATKAARLLVEEEESAEEAEEAPAPAAPAAPAAPKAPVKAPVKVSVKAPASSSPASRPKVARTQRPDRPLAAPPALGKIPFPLGERLVYKVNMLNAHSGTVTIKVGQRGVLNGVKVVELSGFIQSSPFLENFYPIRDSLVVLADEVTFRPLKSDFFLNEKGSDIKFFSEYDLATGDLKWRKIRRVNGKEREARRSFKGPGALYESLSSLYALRRLDIKPGLRFEQYVWDGQRERLVEVRVVGEDRVLTEMGWFDTHKIEISSVITGGVVRKGDFARPPLKGTAWVAKDSHRTPVKLITPTRLGQAEAVLSQRSVDPVGVP